MNRFEELGKEYESLRNWTRTRIAGPVMEEFAAFYTASVLRIWSVNELYSPDYQKALLYTQGEKFTPDQIMTAMQCCGEQQRKLVIPSFYKQVLEEDRRRTNQTVRSFLEKLNALLIMSALINGDFTVEEAGMVTKIMEQLTEFAVRNGVRVAGPRMSKTAVTERNTEGYYTKNALLAKMRTGQAADKKETSNSAWNITGNTAKKPGGGGEQGIGSEDSREDVRKNTLMEESLLKQDEIGDPEKETTQTLLAELDSLVGLENIKKDVHSLINFIRVAKIRESRGMKVPVISYHLVFTGNPGTGKTTVARLVARLYYQMGLLPKGQLVETDRSALVAGYLGQTAIKTQKVISEAMGGVLFIDEAYALAADEQDSYGKEAVETILKAMEDHRDELVVIVAGYTEPMHHFIDSNPGLSSRFSKYFAFEDYTDSELIEIFRLFCTRNGYELTQGAEHRLGEIFRQMCGHKEAHFGNARTARNLFEKMIGAQADRIAEKGAFTDAELILLTEEDVEAVV